MIDSKEEMRRSILSEVSVAWDHNPDLTINEVIALALDFSWPTRKGHKKATNSDILKALIRYNTVKVNKGL